jgi:hypothetical protein
VSINKSAALLLLSVNVSRGRRGGETTRARIRCGLYDARFLSLSLSLSLSLLRDSRVRRMRSTETRSFEAPSLLRTSAYTEKVRSPLGAGLDRLRVRRD